MKTAAIQSTFNVHPEFVVQLLSDLEFYKDELKIIKERMLLMEKKLSGTGSFDTIVSQLKNLLDDNDNELHSLKQFFSNNPTIEEDANEGMKTIAVDLEAVNQRYMYFNKRFAEMRDYFNRLINPNE